MSKTANAQPPTADDAARPPRLRRRLSRALRWLALLLLIALIVGRLTMSYFVRQYVNHVLNSSQSFSGHIRDVHIHLWRGAYEIDSVRLVKTTGNVPVPLFSAKRLWLQIEWPALLHGKIVGRVEMDEPELNFVDAPSEADSQTGGGGPWLQILRDLFPFKINSVKINNASVHFRTYRQPQPVDVYLSELNGSVDNLTNVRDQANPLLTNITADGLAMDQAQFQLRMKLNPFSYNPSFELAVRLLGLEVTKINDLTRTYGKFDAKDGLFDFVLQANAKSGQISGYALPLFRNLRVFDLTDLQEADPLHAFWQALVGTATEILKNQNRNQFGTQIPFTASINDPKVDLLTAIGNILRNAFIRAYLPRFDDDTTEVNEMHFDPPKLTDSISVGDKDAATR